MKIIFFFSFLLFFILIPKLKFTNHPTSTTSPIVVTPKTQSSPNFKKEIYK